MPQRLGILDPVDRATAARYRARGWWSDRTLVDFVADNVAARPGRPAFTTELGLLSWIDYQTESSRLAQVLIESGLGPGARVGIRLPDGPAYHVAQLACELAGLVAVGIAARAGERELRHLLARTATTALVSHARHHDTSMAALVDTLPAIAHHVVVPTFDRGEDGPLRVNGDVVAATADPAALAARRLGPDDLWLINSTSGTTGLPKCVTYHQNRQFYFGRMVIDCGELTTDDVIMSVVPTPYGFGQWSAHCVPTYLGVNTVLTDRFDTAQTLRLIERERVTVLCAVSTQFRLLLADPLSREVDFSSLRVMFTGGEPVTYESARRFEMLTAAAILNIYGSNEAGFVSATTVRDSPERRLRTAGRVPPGTELRLLDDRGAPAAGPRGQAAARGPSITHGYLDDPGANAELFTADGFVRQADIVEVDADGYLTVVGRSSELIIRGGKNISAAEVEEEVSAHPRVALACAVAMRDAIFGERVCVFVELNDSGPPLRLEQLTAYLLDRKVSKELLPERLEVLQDVPRSAGGKIARADLRRRADVLAAEVAER